MNKQTTLMLALALACNGAAMVAAQAAVVDRVAPAVVSAAVPAGEFEHAPVQFAWALNPADVVSAPEPEVMESRSSWRMVEAAELQSGVDVPVSAAGAVIQLSPARGAKALDVQSLQVREGSAPVAARRFERAALKDAGMAVAPGTAMLKLQDSQPGRYRVQATDARGSYVMQVLEPDSPMVLRARTDRSVALAGDTLRAQVNMDGVQSTRAEVAARLAASRFTAEGLLVAPDGRTWTVPMRSDKAGGLVADVAIPAGGSDVQGLWELQVFADQGGIARDTRLAFAVARPTARLASAVRATSLSDLRFPVQVGAPGRYEVRTTLFATGTDGKLRAVAQGHSAAWFAKPGRGELALSFAGVKLPAGYAAPYELREVELHDQTRMAPIERRARAVRF
ncbi:MULTISPECIES: DUF4785 domain-containing protein [Stenotrophomonas]|uniref:DUF4785 domain-containing protein n=1 Tax=Stenotrophomonas TaxID=40323 RepID=UPI00077046A7|nr:MULTISPECIES: DUF4785 domain-containing protein [Stenotrophomonas]AMJ58239.1 hypothetical protein AXG53_17555 [Stenotrophomonas sp. KCTC 12332]